MLKITRNKDRVKYIVWNGMEIYCGMTNDSQWVIELCLNSDNRTFGRFTIPEFSLETLQEYLDAYYSDKVKCHILLVGIFNGLVTEDGTIYPGIL